MNLLNECFIDSFSFINEKETNEIKEKSTPLKEENISKQKSIEFLQKNKIVSFVSENGREIYLKLKPENKIGIYFEGDKYNDTLNVNVVLPPKYIYK